MLYKDLPKIGEQLDGGIFAGLTTKPDGTHCAVVLLPGVGSNLDWEAAKVWATRQGGELPSRSVAALLFANVKEQLRPEEHWTSDDDATYHAWYCYFVNGFQDDCLKCYECSAVAVRLITVEV